MKRTTGSLEADFHRDMLAIYDLRAKAGFRPVLLRRFVLLQGGVTAARKLLEQPGVTGLERLQQQDMADASMEALILKPQYEPLFTPQERKLAATLLAARTSSRSRGRLNAVADRS
ncbi:MULTISPECIES: hypothetical protein [unclassified Rhizobium]|uniref:hypothetical protein n=1 Tax=unclassified Rhizobium TaxID=2613769 RepID=UPI0006FC95F6|nr:MULTISPECIES: hypothetical protein [unclassified Rhizobium]KQV44465.1 hypothetical protein ASC86_06830 [Rhizobium sp. Root1212]KRD38646.1 hypothetical protein ASE37_06830 [Rhizobium sp. Root268]